jgi:hypothetical protein
LVFEKKARIFAENGQKSQKILIITWTPDKKIAFPIGVELFGFRAAHI